jgi:hypothetical protein
MFRDDESNCSSPVDLALQLAQDLLQRCIRSTVTLKTGKRNGVGLLLYHTKQNRVSKKEGEDADEHDDDEMEDDDDDDESTDQASTVHVLLPLVPPGVAEVKTIRSCLSKERDLRQEFSCFSHDGEEEEPRIAPLQTALEESTRIFRKAKCVKDSNSAKANEAIDSRSIWIFTNRENPYPASNHLIQNVARDAKEQGIQIVVWPLPSPTAPTPLFSHLPFYQDIASYTAFDNRLQSLEDLEDGLEDLQQHFKKIRRLYYGPMLMPDCIGGNRRTKLPL